MKFMATWIVIAGIFLQGCSQTQKIKQVEKKEPDCFETLIASNSLKQWCSALPSGLSRCECDTPLIESRMHVFSQLSENNFSPSDLKDWYQAFESDVSVFVVASWMNSGVPLGVAPLWRKLGITPVQANIARTLQLPQKKMLETFLYEGIEFDIAIQWAKSGLSIEEALLWIEQGISLVIAKDRIHQHNLISLQKMQNYLFDLNFLPISINTQAHTWICSRDNRIAQVSSINNETVSFIQRYRFIDKAGYELPVYSLFSNKGRIDTKGFFSRTIKRGMGNLASWSECSPSVQSHLDSQSY